jgi:hypothetical protein
MESILSRRDSNAVDSFRGDVDIGDVSLFGGRD